MSDTITIDKKLHEDVIGVLRSCREQLDTIKHPDFGKPVLLIERVNKAIARLQGKPTPRSFEDWDVSAEITLKNSLTDNDKNQIDVDNAPVTGTFTNPKV